MTFEIRERDAAGRICTFTTKHGTVTTPNLLPVINPNKMVIPPKEMKKRFGVEIVITNSYIIHKDPQLRNLALEKGVHHLIDFNGPIMTDSGTFQSYVYGDVKVDPVDIVRFQRGIGSDIGTILDIFGTPGQTQKEAAQGVKETVARAKRSIPEKGEMLLACTVQGSIYPNLRQSCAKELSALDADFFPIGGVVPLMENQRYADLVRCILAAKKGLTPSKPVHLFGAGHPLMFPLAVALGCDFFDSSAYAKYAQDDRMIFSWGTEKLGELTELPCTCPVCATTTADELKKMEKNERVHEIALHNLYVSFSELKTIRSAITGGWLWELVEQRAASNPALCDAERELRRPESVQWLEQFEPTSRKTALFYTGPHTIHRPTLHRYHTRLLERYRPIHDTTVLLPERTKPYSIFYAHQVKKILAKKAVDFVVDASLGPVPLELDEMYPLAQSVFPEIVDRETEEYTTKILKKLLKGRRVVRWDEIDTKLKKQKLRKKIIDEDLRRVSAVVEMQFGQGASPALLQGSITILKSKKTGKIRTVHSNGKHILSMRAEDGLFTLKSEGARLLHQKLKYPLLRVIVAKDAIPFVQEGKSLFAKFVLGCDPELRPFDECLLVDENDTLLAVGRTFLTRDEMSAFQYGLAVKNREPVGNENNC